MKVIWQMCWPVLLYGLIVDMALVFWGEGEPLLGTFAGALLAIPILGWLYRIMPEKIFDPDWGNSAQKGGMARQQKQFCLKDGIHCIVIGIAACVAVNTLIMLSPLPSCFTGFFHTAEKLYGPSVLLQAGAMGVAIPAAEELVFRGFVFGELRKEHPFAAAACLSAAVFGIYHGNMLQGIYGWVLGWILAWVMEKKGTVKAPVLMHMAANLTAVIWTAL